MRILLFALTSILIFTFVPNAVAQNTKVTPANVSAAIEKCVSFLINEQLKDGDRRGAWAGHELYNTGQTCLVTLALLSAGRATKHAEINRALTYIRGNQKPQRTYEAALQVMVLCAAEPSKDMAQIKNVIKWLISVQSSNGGWGYGDGDGDDESNTQFAVLALWEASKLEIFADPDLEKALKKAIPKCTQYWLDKSTSEGWEYRKPPTIGSMTCAGIASLIILQDASIGMDASVKDNRIHCCGDQAATSKQETASKIEGGLQWLSKNFAASHNPGATGFTFYYLYALERVGRLTGQRMIGKFDWYREGAEYLLQSQQLGGSFRDGSDDVSSSAMALLFLSKGKRQVVIGHLQFGNDKDWQHHRRAVQNMTGHIEKVWKRELAWQSIRLEQADLRSLLETPILFISGSREFRLNDPQRKLLKDYVEQNGFIIAEACNGEGCDGDAFDRSFKSEMEKIFDKPLQKLPPTHPIWTAETRVDPNALPKNFWMYGLDACCRTSVVYSPISLSCRWELARPYGIAMKHGANIDADILNAVKLGVNVAAYATGRELKDKLDAVQIVQAQKNKQPLERGSLAIGKIQHIGGADDTPGAVSNLLEIYHRESQALVESKTPMVSLVSDEVQKYPTLYIHGRNKFAFSDEEAKGLRKHFETGGFVMGDAICASADFWESVRREFTKALPDSNWRIVDLENPLMKKDTSGNFSLLNVSMVDPSNPGSDLRQAKREGPAEIHALEWKGRIVMLFSPNDLSCALESKHSMQCRGYVRADAFRIGINMIRFALGLSG